MATKCVVLAGALALAACNSSALNGGRDASAPPDAGSIDLASQLADGSATDDAGACGPEIQALATEMYVTQQSCTAVVRLDYSSLSVLSYQLICGHYGGLGEADARAVAQADTGYGGTDTMLSPPQPGDEYVFYRSPGDFGGASAVSTLTGLSVFGGSIIWDGAGDLTWPTTWRSVATLGQGCPASGGINSRRGYDLSTGGPLPQQSVDAAVGVVLGTAVPAAMWWGGYVFNAVVLLYPRSVGVFDPKTAEWIVLVNGGWLE